MKTKTSGALRLMSEFQNLRNNPHPNYEVFICNDNIFKWRVVMKVAQEDSNDAYAGAVFVINILFPENYPEDSPEIRFETPILHCNVNSHGKV